MMNGKIPTFTTNLIRDIDTETLNNKLNDIKMNIINVRLTKKQQNPYSLQVFILV